MKNEINNFSKTITIQYLKILNQKGAEAADCFLKDIMLYLKNSIDTNIDEFTRQSVISRWEE